MIIKRFNTILSKGEQKLCTTDLLFNPAYLTDTEWVSKTDACPVLSVVAGDNTIEGLGSNTIVDIITDTTYELNSGVISFSTSGYVSYLELSNGSKYNFTGKNANDLTENNLNLTITGAQTDLWNKSRVLLKGDDRTGVENIEKVKGKFLSNCIKGNGTDTLITTTLPENIRLYVDNIIINYSTDGIVREAWQTGDVAVSGLYSYDQETGVLQFFYDGTNRFSGWIDSFTIQTESTTETFNLLDFHLASGSASEYNLADESIWDGVINVAGIFNLNTVFTLTGKII